MVSLDSSVCGFDIGGFERGLTNDKGVDDDTKRPDIDLIRMTSSSLQHLWSDIIWSTANSSLLFPIEVEFCSKTEISEFDLHLRVDEQIS